MLQFSPRKAPQCILRGYYSDSCIVARARKAILNATEVNAFLVGDNLWSLAFQIHEGAAGGQMAMMKVLIADDHEIVRKGLRAILEGQRECEVVGEAGDGRNAVTMAKELVPDVVVMDLSMPSLNGLEATRQILKMRPQTKVLILTMHESDPLIREVLDAGARGYILKTDAGRDLLAALEALRRNKTFFTSRVAQMILDGFLKGDARPVSDTQPKAGRLTARQREIVQLLAEGKSSKEVAVALGLSVKTAETHRANIMRKLDCHCVSEVVRYAIRNKIIEA
jgi:DNA-binding NarL/FixJ family response regulator